MCKQFNLFQWKRNWNCNPVDKWVVLRESIYAMGSINMLRDKCEIVLANYSFSLSPIFIIKICDFDILHVFCNSMILHPVGNPAAR